MDWKTDDRPKRFGWAPGDYTCQCPFCKDKYMGDKRSMICADCAYSGEHDTLFIKNRILKVNNGKIDLYVADSKLFLLFKESDAMVFTEKQADELIVKAKEIIPDIEIEPVIVDVR
jgi:hypothetical protein